MTVNELIDKLTKIKEENLGELLVASETYNFQEITECEVKLSRDNIGKYVKLS